MKLFNFLQRRADAAQGAAKPETEPEDQNTRVIPKEIFIEEHKPDSGSLSFHSNGQKVGLDLVYEFLQTDFEPKGFNDALTNPDQSYRDDNVKLIKHDLAILVKRVDSYYDELLKELDFHIESRKRSGLIDTVTELSARKSIVLNQIERLNEIKHDIELGNGLTNRVVLSYQRGFLRGLAALSQSSVLKRKV